MPLTVDDRLEMIELVSRYNQAIDARHAESWADTFTDDGVFRIRDGAEVRGRDALIAMVESLEPQGVDPTRHWTTNYVIDGDGDQATMQVDLVLLSGSSVVATGRYVNALERRDGGWRFVRRDFLPD